MRQRAEQRVLALIVAAGRGIRAGSGGPKQYRRIGGRPVMAWTIDQFLRHEKVDLVAVVIHREDGQAFANSAPQNEKLLPPVEGGESRQDSVRLGLEAGAASGATHVLIHDAARPFTSGGVIDRVVEALAAHDAVLPASPVADTLLKDDGAGFAAEQIERSGLYGAETPQGFRLSPILDAHRRAVAEKAAFTDDAGLARWAGMKVKLVAGDRANIKLTTAEDIAAADRRLLADSAAALGDVRVGTGYDVHRLGGTGPVMLGGIPIPHESGLIGHSDADVALHALTDAVLGALGDGDIGTHFPPSDMGLHGVSSDRFLAYAAARVAARGGRIAHLDLAIVAEAPRIGPHREAMRARIAAICGIGVDRVSVKATTNEGLGFLGRGEGIAAIGTATLRLPLAET